VPTEYGHSKSKCAANCTGDNKDCSETNQQQNVYLYSLPIQCASENDAATSECVGPVKMESADAVQDKNEKADPRSEVLERTVAEDVQAEFEDEKTSRGARIVESRKIPLCYSFHKDIPPVGDAFCLELPSRPPRPSHQRFENAQRNRSTEMILISHAISLGVCYQILRHCLRGMQPFCSGSSSEYKKEVMLAIMKVCDRVKHSVQQEQLMQHVAEKQLAVLGFSGVIHSLGNNLITSSSPDLLLDMCSLTGKPNKVAGKSQPGKGEWLHSKKANILPCMTFSKSCVRPVFAGYDTFAYLTGASNHKESATGEKETELMGPDSRIMFQQVKRVVTRQLQAKTKYNCPFTVKDNYAEVVIQSMLLVKALFIHNFLHSAKILEHLDEIKRDVSSLYKQAVWAFNVSQIIFYLKSKWSQYSRKGYDFLLKIKAVAIHTFETTLKMQVLCKI